jgi:hypothetical protein
MSTKRWPQFLRFGVLVVGLLGVSLATVKALHDSTDVTLPGPAALGVAAVVCLGAIVCAGRAWSVLFNDHFTKHGDRVAARGGFYVSQPMKYLPVGGVVQAASQLSLASSAGVPVGRVAVAFPVSAVCSVSAGATLSAGLVFDPDLSPWVRGLCLLGLASPLLLHRRLMAAVLSGARHVVHRIPKPDRLPLQRNILASYGWAALAIAAFSTAYAVLLSSVTDADTPTIVFSAYALSWTIGFLAIPIPAGVGVREALLVALIPGVGVGPILAASLGLRLLAIVTELIAIGGNKWAARRDARARLTDAEQGELLAR